MNAQQFWLATEANLSAMINNILDNQPSLLRWSEDFVSLAIILVLRKVGEERYMLLPVMREREDDVVVEVLNNGVRFILVRNQQDPNHCIGRLMSLGHVVNDLNNNTVGQYMFAIVKCGEFFEVQFGLQYVIGCPRMPFKWIEGLPVFDDEAQSSKGRRIKAQRDRINEEMECENYDDQEFEEKLEENFKDDRYNKRNGKQNYVPRGKVPQTYQRIQGEKRSDKRITGKQLIEDRENFLDILIKNGYVWPPVPESCVREYDMGLLQYLNTGILPNRYRLLKGLKCDYTLKVKSNGETRRSRLLWIYERYAKLNPALWLACSKIYNSEKEIPELNDQERCDLLERVMPLVPKVQLYRGAKSMQHVLGKNYQREILEDLSSKLKVGKLDAKAIVDVITDQAQMFKCCVGKDSDGDEAPGIFATVRSFVRKQWEELRDKFISFVGNKMLAYFIFISTLVLVVMTTVGACGFLSWLLIFRDTMNPTVDQKQSLQGWFSEGLNKVINSSLFEASEWEEAYLKLSRYKSSTEAVKYFTVMIQEIIDSIYYKMMGKHLFDKYADKEVFIKDLEELTTFTEINSKTESLRFIRLYEGLLRSCRRLITEPKEYSMMQGRISSYQDMYAEAKKLAGGQSRPTPICIYIHGESSAGKSFLAANMVKILYESYLQHVGLTKATSRFGGPLYSRNQMDDYWSGYKNQFAILYDDAYQLKDEPGKRALTSMELINVVNCAPYSLNMADLLSKGVTYCTSPLVIVTSNEANPENLGIQSSAALRNRFTYYLKAEALTGEKLKYGEKISAKNLSRRVQLRMSTTGQGDGEVIDMNDFLSTVLSDIVRNERMSDDPAEIVTVEPIKIYQDSIIRTIDEKKQVKDTTPVNLVVGFRPETRVQTQPEFFDDYKDMNPGLNEAQVIRKENFDGSIDQESGEIEPMDHDGATVYLTQLNDVVKVSSIHGSAELIDCTWVEEKVSFVAPFIKPGRPGITYYKIKVDQLFGDKKKNLKWLEEEMPDQDSMHSSSMENLKDFFKKLYPDFLYHETDSYNLVTYRDTYFSLFSGKYYKTSSVHLSKEPWWVTEPSLRVSVGGRSVEVEDIFPLLQKNFGSWKLELLKMFHDCKEAMFEVSTVRKMIVDLHCMPFAPSRKITEDDIVRLTEGFRMIFSSMLHPSHYASFKFIEHAPKWYREIYASIKNLPRHTYWTREEVVQYCLSNKIDEKTRIAMGINDKFIAGRTCPSQPSLLDWLFVYVSPVELVVAISGLTTLAVFITLCVKMFAPKKDEDNPQSEDPITLAIQKRMMATQRPKRVEVRYVKKQSDTQGIVYDEPQFQKFNALWKNLRYLVVRSKNGTNLGAGHAMMIKGRVGLTARHYFIEDWDTIELCDPSQPGNTKVCYSRENVKTSLGTELDGKLEEKDQAYFCLTHGNLSKDISEHMAAGDVTEDYFGFSRLEYMEGTPNSRSIATGMKSSSRYMVGTHDSVTQHTVGVRFMTPGWAGLCGTPYTKNTETVQNTWQFIHVAGNNLSSVATRVVKEEYTAFVDLMGVDKKECRIDPVVEFGASKVNFTPRVGISKYPGYELVGEVSRKSSQPHRTDFEPSIIWETQHGLESKHLPAILSHPEIDLYEKGLAKKSKILPPEIPEMNDPRNFDGVFVDGVVPRSFQKVTIKEIIKGTLTSPPISAQTASGPPFTASNIDKKLDIVDFEKGELREPYLKRFNDMEDNYQKGIVESQLTDGCLKDELRLKEKVLAFKTRVFFIMCMLFNMLSKKYFLKFFEAIQTSFELDVGVGFNPYSEHWKDIYFYLKKKGMKYDFADASAWDLGFYSTFLYYLADKMKEWFDLEEKDFLAVRSILIAGLFPYVCITDKKTGRHLVYTGAQMPSGWYCTLMLNSIFHSWKRRVIWHVFCKMACMDASFSRFNRLKVHGDDAVHGFLQSDGLVVIDGYGAQFIAWASEKYFNVVHTNCFKDGPPEDMEFEKGEFLKRKFVFKGGKVMGPLAKDSIERMLLWVRKSDVPPQIQFAITSQVAVNEAFYHGKEYYEKIRSIVNRCLCQHQLSGYMIKLDYEAQLGLRGRLL